MSDNFFDELKKKSPSTSSKASEAIRKALGDGFDPELLLKNEKLKNNLELRLTEEDKKKVAMLASNPELLKKLLAFPNIRDGIRNFLQGK